MRSRVYRCIHPVLFDWRLPNTVWLPYDGNFAKLRRGFIDYFCTVDYIADAVDPFLIWRSAEIVKPLVHPNRHCQI